MSDPTVAFILEVPVLDDKAVAAVNAFLWDLLVQFESQYYSQLQRHHRKLDALRRDPREPWKDRRVGEIARLCEQPAGAEKHQASRQETDS